jgi:hypothetical protein
MVGGFGFNNAYRMINRIPSRADRLVPPYLQAYMPAQLKLPCERLFILEQAFCFNLQIPDES